MKIPISKLRLIVIKPDLYFPTFRNTMAVPLILTRNRPYQV